LIDARGGWDPSSAWTSCRPITRCGLSPKETGGAAFFPRFQGEYGSIFQQIHQALRNQYVITYSSSNKAHDGMFRKIRSSW